MTGYFQKEWNEWLVCVSHRTVLSTNHIGCWCWDDVDWVASYSFPTPHVEVRSNWTFLLERNSQLAPFCTWEATQHKQMSEEEDLPGGTSCMWWKLMSYHKLQQSMNSNTTTAGTYTVSAFPDFWYDLFQFLNLNWGMPWSLFEAFFNLDLLAVSSFAWGWGVLLAYIIRKWCYSCCNATTVLAVAGSVLWLLLVDGPFIVERAGARTAAEVWACEGLMYRMYLTDEERTRAII